VTGLSVHKPGPLTTVQDLGRPGYAHLGVPPSGALDVPAFDLANQLVGNPRGSAALETTFGGLSVSADKPVVIAATGAPAPMTIDDRPSQHCRALNLLPGERLTLGVPTAGVRTYVAISGGVDVQPAFGSRSRDLLSRIGPEPLRRGDVLPLGTTPTLAAAPPVDAEPADCSSLILLGVHPGPRADWFLAGTYAFLCSTMYRVSMHGNRIGVRLEGPVLQRRGRDELLSEGLVTGSIEVPPDGQPLVLLADHPTTGGYPTIAVVDPTDLWKLAQARPGNFVRFFSVSSPLRRP
jgi:biotin-dependent carboxylase-like uncharacterized protein